MRRPRNAVKRCTQCGTTDKDAFYHCGKTSRCKECNRAYLRERYVPKPRVLPVPERERFSPAAALDLAAAMRGLLA